MSRHVKVLVSLAALALSVGAVRAQAATAPTAAVVAEETTLECSDPGRSCSVDRNCCSGVCQHGNCQ